MYDDCFIISILAPSDMTLQSVQGVKLLQLFQERLSENKDKCMQQDQKVVWVEV